MVVEGLVEWLAGVVGLRGSVVTIEAVVRHWVRSHVGGMVSVGIVWQNGSIISRWVNSWRSIVRDQRNIAVRIAVTSSWRRRGVGAVVRDVPLGARSGWKRRVVTRGSERIQGARYCLWRSEAIVAVGGRRWERWSIVVPRRIACCSTSAGIRTKSSTGGAVRGWGRG